jgi:hypothetical protein
MASHHLRLTLCLVLNLATPSAWSQEPAPAAMPKPDQTPASTQPSVRQIPPPKAPAPVAPTTAVPTMPSRRAPLMAAPQAPAADAKAPLQKFADGLALLLLTLKSYQDPTPNQKNRIMIALKSLKSGAAEVQPLIARGGAESVMAYISFDLFKNLLRLEAAVNAGTFSYARYLLRQITHYTILWQQGQTPKSAGALQFTEPPASISDLDKAEYYAAIKKYQEAMLAYERVLNDKQFRKTRPDIWERAVENLMAITIRIRNDPHITLEMTSTLRDESASSPAQREMLLAWRNSAKAWTTEIVVQKMSGNDLLAKAQQVVDKGHQLNSKGHNLGMIEYLRGMSLLNVLAGTQPNNLLKAKGFQLAGKTREKLQNVFIWMHADAYYEACIRARPHSAESKECMKLFESFQTQEKDVVPDRDKLKQLSELAR